MAHSMVFALQQLFSPTTAAHVAQSVGVFVCVCVCLPVRQGRNCKTKSGDDVRIMEGTCKARRPQLEVRRVDSGDGILGEGQQGLGEPLQAPSTSLIGIWGPPVGSRAEPWLKLIFMRY